jgi:hypothetical protein
MSASGEYEYGSLVLKHNVFARRYPGLFPEIGGEAVFHRPAAPLPYEQTTRTPIPEAVRSEVWRRDLGRCVQCNSKENLQFDHLIPIDKGGATSVANLQLLCRSCNLKKHTRI